VTARPTKEKLRDAWRRLRGGDLTPGRAAASVAIGLAIGVTPLWGVHWLLVLAICVPLRLDGGVAFLASNVSLPFIAPFITFAELEVGSLLVRGHWLGMTAAEARSIVLTTVLAEVGVGTLVMMVGSAIVGGALAYAMVAWRRRAR
jgi:uncharacterized protein (DUF2062 family)